VSELDARIDVLRLEPGDILALRANRRITMEQADHMRKLVLDEVGDGYPILIFPPDIELMVVRYPLTDEVTP
jgi:hypothetical protein